MVGAGRFERPTPCAQDIRSPHLRINRFNSLQTLRVGPCGNFSYNLDGKPAIRLAKPPTKPTGSPAGSADCKINQRGRAPAVAAVGRSVVERLADPSYNRDFGQVPGHFPERRFPDHWHSFRGRRLPTGTSRREEPWPGRYYRSVAADGCALTGATRSRVLLKKALRLWCVRMVATDVIDWEFL